VEKKKKGGGADLGGRQGGRKGKGSCERKGELMPPWPEERDLGRVRGGGKRKYWRGKNVV